jgi:hypothetical protein
MAREGFAHCFASELRFEPADVPRAVCSGFGGSNFESHGQDDTGGSAALCPGSIVVDASRARPILRGLPGGGTYRRLRRRSSDSQTAWRESQTASGARSRSRAG